MLLVLSGCSSTNPSGIEQAKRHPKVSKQSTDHNRDKIKHLATGLSNAHDKSVVRHTPDKRVNPAYLWRDAKHRDEASFMRYQNWLNALETRRVDVDDYYAHLTSSVGNVPPIYEIVRSARSWQDCGFEPFEVPPRFYWDNMTPTLRLVNLLQSQGYLPAHIEIVSAYRNPELNECAKGSAGSKHLINAAVDIRINYTDEFERLSTEANLCNFWRTQGEFYEFGLGLYRSGTIHVDTQGYRTWGSSYGGKSSPCVLND